MTWHASNQAPCSHRPSNKHAKSSPSPSSSFSSSSSSASLTRGFDFIFKIYSLSLALIKFRRSSNFSLLASSRLPSQSPRSSLSLHIRTREKILPLRCEATENIHKPLSKKISKIVFHIKIYCRNDPSIHARIVHHSELRTSRFYRNFFYSCGMRAPWIHAFRRRSCTLLPEGATLALDQLFLVPRCGSARTWSSLSIELTSRTSLFDWQPHHQNTGHQIYHMN